MGQTEEAFYKSSIGKVVKMISLYYEENKNQEIHKVNDITSMKEIEGW